MKKVAMKQVLTGIEDQMKGMLDRSKRMQAYLNRVVYRQYQNAQRERWISMNSSEGNRWPDLNKKYAQSKLTRFASYPGGGRKMLIATNRLFKSVVGPSPDHKKIATNSRLEIGWSTPYAEYVDSVRTFSEFGQKTMNEIYDGLAKFLMEGILRDVK